ncbi:HD domain-containing phosphohydrolase [Sneathiella sp.]|jgi:PAS domain S-box-containing protein|uniref:HD domain-containing phosphohydrolase n=1 Tax=Sneathiella sp. TaxID=1964365 RepID=UPI0039E5C3C6
MSDIQEETYENKRTYRMVWLGAISLALVVALGVWGTISFVGKQHDRDIQNWEIRLGIVADSRVAAVEGWLAEQKSAINSLSENASLQVYLTQLVLDTEENGLKVTEVPEAGYLINLLNNHAVISGFWEPEEPQINANVARPGRAGIALTDRTGTLLVSSGNMPPMNPSIRAAIAEADQGRAAVIDLYEGLDGEPTMGFVYPIFAVQSAGDPNKVIGFVVGLRTVRKSLFPLLLQPGEVQKTAETILVRERGALTEYISPLADGTPALKRRVSSDDKLAAAFAARNPGLFAIKSNYLGDEVLVTGRAISGAPWFLVRSVTTIEALSETRERRNAMLGVFLLLILGITGTVVAVWRHGTSLRAAELAEKYKKVAEELRERTEFLKVVTDQQPTAIAVFDQGDRYAFANKLAADNVELLQDEILGRKLSSVMNPESSKKLLDMLHFARQDNAVQSAVMSLPDPQHGDRIVKSDIIPLRTEQNDVQNMLAVFQDITEVVTERERRENVLRSLVSALVAFVDKRDPYSAHQSVWVAEVAVAIAEELNASERVIRTVDISGNLMNLGKILVPSKILTKTERLTEDELRVIRESLVSSADLLENVKFDLPIAETLRQLQEHWDGTGHPRGLKETAINEAARIVAVANAFVGMVSPRAYRDAFDFNKAVSILLEEADKKYDRKPISALINFLENGGGREKWQHFSNTLPDPEAEEQPGD